MSRDIIDAAVMQQFKEYLVKKGAYLLDNGVSDASFHISINWIMNYRIFVIRTHALIKTVSLIVPESSE